MRLSPTDMYTDFGWRYIDVYVGLVKCYLRALSNVNIRAAAEAFSLGIVHGETDKVLDVSKKYEDGSTGKIFHVRKQHWVALQRFPGSDAAVFYDDLVLMRINSYDSTTTLLKLL